MHALEAPPRPTTPDSRPRTPDYVCTADCLFFRVTLHAYGYTPAARGSRYEPDQGESFDDLRVFLAGHDITAQLSRNDYEGLRDEALYQMNEGAR